MKINFHGLAFKQSAMILLGISVVFAALFGFGSSQIQERMSRLLLQKGEEISRANVAVINNLFGSCRNFGEELAVKIGDQQLAGTELDDFLLRSLSGVRATVPQVLAVVVAYEPGMAPKGAPEGEYMRLAHYTENGNVITDGGNYQETTWYTSTRDSMKGIWQEPFIGQFIKEPIVIYTTPIFSTSASGQKQFAGVLCVDISIAFLKDMVASIPVSNNGYAVVLSASNMVIAHPKDEITFKENFGSISKSASRKRFDEFEKAVSSMKSGLFLGSSFEGDEAAIYFTAMETIDWTFMIVWPADSFLEEQRSVNHVFAWISAGGYLIMLVIILVITFRVSRPLKTLAAAAEKLGHGDFDTEIPEVKGKDEISQLADAFVDMRSSLKEFVDKQKGLDRIERELEFAHSIQMGILPKDESEENCCDSRHSLAPFMQPAKEVGGDFYDFFKIDEDHLAVVVGDASGKSVPAALLMMVSRIVIRTVAMHLRSVTEILEETNYELARRNKSVMFVTAWMGILDLRTGHVDFASAGHNPPAIRHKDGTVEYVKSKSGLVLAADEKTTYKQQSLDLAPGDMLFLYTDGVTEATNAEEVMFGTVGLQKALSESGNRPPVGACHFVKERIDEFVNGAPQFDDITMLAVQFIGSKDNEWEKHEIVVDAKLENQPSLTQFVEQVLEPLGGSMKSQMQIDVAIDEIFSNIVKFSGANQVTLTVETCKSHLMARLSFIDGGSPYDPTSAKEPDVTLSAEERSIGGLGLFIVKKTMDDVAYRRDGSKNILTITKKL